MYLSTEDQGIYRLDHSEVLALEGSTEFHEQRATNPASAPDNDNPNNHTPQSPRRSSSAATENFWAMSSTRLFGSTPTALTEQNLRYEPAEAPKPARADNDAGRGSYIGPMGTGEISGPVVHQKKTLVLCFDGTGNMFKGNSGDTNILKIFRMLDRRKGNQYHYYQPGIGTYLTSKAMTHKTASGMSGRIKQAYHKSVDAAVGTSFDQHVMGGYKFLMKYYHPNDDIYMFGFSRGAYTARFLAEMLDHVGLVSQGNEEMVHFAWKTFSEWQMRVDDKGPGGRKKTEEMYNYMKAFRETFARPVKRLRFLGLFDTVNSVRRFENAWLSRSSRFPYNARSTARVIRHAVGLDERRAKFRLDLVEKLDKKDIDESIQRERRKGKKRSWTLAKAAHESGNSNLTRAMGIWTLGRKQEGLTGAKRDLHGGEGGSFDPEHPSASLISLTVHLEKEEGGDDNAEQDVEELWFPGAHGDIGGGWDLADGEPSLSYGPLVWMVREARKAGLVFDERRLKELGCWTDLDAEAANAGSVTLPENNSGNPRMAQMNPAFEVSDASSLGNPTTATSPVEFFQNGTIQIGPVAKKNGLWIPRTVGTELQPEKPLSAVMPITTTLPDGLSPVTNTPAVVIGAPVTLKKDVDPRTESRLLASYTNSKIHDCLKFGGGLSHLGTLGWKMMEYLPFRRMDLQPDGSWKSIIWPLPKGEVRDVPDGAKVHCSVLRRMEADKSYRPGNLLVGGGGRGVRVAPQEYGMGEWVVVKEEGGVIGEVLVKRNTLTPKDLERNTGDASSKSS